MTANVQPTPALVRVYWRPGCPYCAMLRLGLRGARLTAEWGNIWEDRSAAAAVREITGGDETVPTVVVGAKTMVNPSARQVVAAARAARPGADSKASGPKFWLKRAVTLLARRAGGSAADRDRQASRTRNTLCGWKS